LAQAATLQKCLLNKRNAYGIDFSYNTRKLLVSGEFVHQINNDVPAVAPKIALLAKSLSSNGAYLQFDYGLTNKLHIYGMYEYWQLKADNKKATKQPLINVFHGLRYILNSRVRWNMFEAGFQQYDKIKEDNFHFATMLEVNF
jgi:hypothetical protein